MTKHETKHEMTCSDLARTAARLARRGDLGGAYVQAVSRLEDELYRPGAGETREQTLARARESARKWIEAAKAQEG